MNEATHFANFKSKHRYGMQVARHIENDASQSNGTGTTQKMQGIKHLPDQLPLWFRVREYLRKAWRVVAAKNDQGRYTVSQPLVLVLVGVMGTAFFAYYWRSSDVQQTQRDEIIRLQTKLEAEQTKNIDQEARIDQARATAQIADRNAARLEGKFDQFALQYGIRNAGKAQPQNGQ